VPEDAATHFTKALTLTPELPTRLIAAYYLGKMGKPVPPLPKRGTKPDKPGTTPPATSLLPGILAPGAASDTKPAATPPPGSPAEPAKKPADEKSPATKPAPR
jgi:hypothetical protein